MIISLLTILLIFSLIFIPKLSLQQNATGDSSDFYYAPGKIVIQFTKEISPVIPFEVAGIVQTGIGPVDLLCYDFKVHTMERQFPSPKYDTPDLTRHFVIKFDESINLEQVVNAFSNLSIYVEKVEKVGVHEYDITPNDTYFSSKQWHLGQASDCDIDAPEAWDIQKGSSSSSVILAIADSGVAYTHTDLDNNIWINPGEIAGNGIDDDGNGKIDDIYGWDWGDEPPDNTPTDTLGHGTHCAGIAAAETNNDEGVAGIAGGWGGQGGCRIMCLCIGHAVPDMSDAASAIQYATDKGAIAINCSWASSNTGGLGEAVDYAIQNGVLIIHSAGNSNCDCPDYLGSRTDVMNVAATNKQDGKASYSNYGSWVDVSAPGGEGSGSDAIYSTIPSGYGGMSGTSMATPMVVGLAGLLKSNRSDWGRQLLWDAIVKVADPIAGQGLGSGRINAYYSLRQTYTPSAPSSLNATATAWTEIKLTWNDNSDNELGFKIERKTSSSEFSEIAAVAKNITNYKDNNVSAGTNYYYRIKAYSVNGDSYSDPDDALIPNTVPNEPSFLQGNFLWSTHQVRLTWSDSSNNEQGFKIERKSEWDPTWEEIDIVEANVTTYYDSNVDPDTFYYYRVRAYNPNGNSSYSPVAHVYVPWY